MKPLVLLKLLLLLSVFHLRGNPTKNPKSTLNGQKVLANTASLALPSVADIDAAIATSETQGRIVKVVSGGLSLPSAMKEVASLPVTFRSAIDGWNYDITVLAMNFTATGSMLTVACKFTLQDGETGNAIYFAGTDVLASGKNGFKGELDIVGTTLTNAKNNELSPEAFALLNGKTEFHEFPLPHFNSNLWMGLDEDSKVSFSCGAFEKFTLSGFLKSYNTVEQETLSGGSTNSGLPYVVAFSGVEVADWQDMYFNGTPANGFRAASYPDLGFHFIDSPVVAVDLSKRQNPPNLPSCANLSGAYWQGIYFERFDVRLPGIFNLKSGAALPMTKGSNLFIDNNGLIGQMVAEKVFTLPEGTAAGIANSDMSLLKITANYTCCGKVNALMNGQIQLPNCDPSVSRLLIDYRLTYDERAGYSYVFSNSENRNSLASNTIRLANGSSMTFMVNDGNLSVNSSYHSVPQISTRAYSNTICLNTTANLTLEGCTDFVEWSSGESALTIDVTPSSTAVYAVRCYDAYCIEANSNELIINVVPVLTTPILEATSYEFCADNNQTISNTALCEGIIEWQYPGSTDWVKGGETVVVSFPTIETRTKLTYGSRCSLNDNCWSEVATIDLDVIPAPTAPAITSNGAYEQCSRDEIYLNSSCESGNDAQWYIDGERSWNAINYKAQLGNHSYNTTCINSYGCESKFSETKYHNVVVCAPVISIAEGTWNPCNGEVVKLEAIGCEGLITQWIVDGVEWGTGSVRYSTFKELGSTLYEAKCVDAGNYSWVSNSIRINYKDCSPPIGYATISIESGRACTGESVVLKATGCGHQVQWYKDNSPILVSETILVTNGSNRYHASCLKNGEESWKSNDINLNFIDCDNGGEGGCDGKSKDPNWVDQNIGVCINNVSYLTEIDENPCSPGVGDIRKTTLGGNACDECGGKSTVANWVNQNQDVCINNVSYQTEKDENPCSPGVGDIRKTTPGGNACDNCGGKSTVANWVNQNQDECRNNISYLTEKDTNPCSPTFGASRTSVAGGDGCLFTTIPVKYLPPVFTVGSNSPVTSISLVKGTQVRVSASCQTGSYVVWTEPVGFYERTVTVNENVTYKAYCKGRLQSTESSPMLDDSEISNVSVAAINPVIKPDSPTITSSSKYVLFNQKVTLTASNCAGTIKWSNGSEGSTIEVRPNEARALYHAFCIVGEERSIATYTEILCFERYKISSSIWMFKDFVNCNNGEGGYVFYGYSDKHTGVKTLHSTILPQPVHFSPKANRWRVFEADNGEKFKVKIGNESYPIEFIKCD